MPVVSWALPRRAVFALVLGAPLLAGCGVNDIPSYTDVTAESLAEKP